MADTSDLDVTAVEDSPTRTRSKGLTTDAANSDDPTACPQRFMARALVRRSSRQRAATAIYVSQPDAVAKLIKTHAEGVTEKGRFLVSAIPVCIW